ncbi:MAG: ArdC-like ssDNA-binding domain-containing protein [Betaproteobacteria bacterium]|jgi:antirestriction protein ArdC
MNCREEVTHRIVIAMLEGPPPWRADWTAGGLPINASTGKAYNPSH